MVKPIHGSVEIEGIYHRILKDLYSRVLGPAAMSRMLTLN